MSRRAQQSSYGSWYQQDISSYYYLPKRLNLPYPLTVFILIRWRVLDSGVNGNFEAYRVAPPLSEIGVVGPRLVSTDFQ